MKGIVNRLCRAGPHDQPLGPGTVLDVGMPGPRQAVRACSWPGPFGQATSTTMPAGHEREEKQVTTMSMHAVIRRVELYYFRNTALNHQQNKIRLFHGSKALITGNLGRQACRCRPPFIPLDKQQSAGHAAGRDRRIASQFISPRTRHLFLSTNPIC